MTWRGVTLRNLQLQPYESERGIGQWGKVLRLTTLEISGHGLVVNG